MIISNFDDVPIDVVSRLISNPINVLANQSVSRGKAFEESFISKAQKISELERDLRTAKIDKLIIKQKRGKNKIELAELTKALKNSSAEINTDFLLPENMTKFFESVGLKFVCLQIINDSSLGCGITYVRPARMINSFPVQPLLISLCYEKQGDELHVCSADATGLFVPGSSYSHPHISSSGSVCMGNYLDILDERNVSLSTENYQDHIIMLENLLTNYNSDSPYRGIDEILIDFTKSNIKFNGMHTYNLNSSSSYTLVNPAYITESNKVCSTKDLISYEYYKEWYAMLDKVYKKPLIEDICARISCVTSNNENEDFDFMVKLRKLIHSLLSIDLLCSASDYSSWGENDDGDDFEEISESNLDDLKDSWIESLEEYAKKLTDERIKFNNLPILDLIFNKIIVEELPGDENVFN